MNKLFYGGDLKILRDNIKDEPVGLIYLDPPFGGISPLAEIQRGWSKSN